MHQDIMNYYTITVFKNYLSYLLDETLDEAYEAENFVEVSLNEK